MMGNPQEVRLPDLGDVGEVLVVEWMVKPGEAVHEGDDLLEVETEKTTFLVPAPKDGILGEIHAPVGAQVRVGDRLGRIDG